MAMLASRLLAKIVLVAVILSVVEATHFRFGHIYWKRLATHRVQFTVESAWRYSFAGDDYTEYGIGDLYSYEFLSASLRFGEDCCSNWFCDGVPRCDDLLDVRLDPRVEAINLNSDWFYGVSDGSSYVYDYPQDGTYVAFVNREQRIVPLDGGQGETRFTFGSQVTLAESDVTKQNLNSPRSSISPIVYLPEPQCCSNRTSCDDGANVVKYTIPALDDDGDTVTFRINQNLRKVGEDDTGYVGVNYGTGVGEGNGLDWVTIDSQTGELSATICDSEGQNSKRLGENDHQWSFANLRNGVPDLSISRYTLQVILEDNHPVEPGFSSIDFMIFISDRSEQPYIVNQKERRPDDGYQFTVSDHDGYPLLTESPPSEDAVYRTSFGLELRFYVYGISQSGRDVRVYTSTSSPFGMEIINDIQTDQPAATTDTALVKWTPTFGARDEVVCFSIQEVGTAVEGYNSICVTIFVEEPSLFIPSVVRDLSAYHADFGYDLPTKPSATTTGAVYLDSDGLHLQDSAESEMYFNGVDDFETWFHNDEAQCTPIARDGNQRITAYDCVDGNKSQEVCESIGCCWDAEYSDYACSFPRGLGADNRRNRYRSYVLPLTENDGSDVLTFESRDFTPIEDELLGNEGRARNFDFTLEISTEFRYTGDTFDLTFESSDDLWVFINGEMVVDLGGIHGRVSQSVVYPPSDHDLAVSDVVPFQVFYASRATSPSITNYLRIDVPGGFGCDAATEGEAVSTYETFDQSIRDNELDVSPNSDDYASIVGNSLEITNFRPSHYLTVYQREALRVQGGFRTEFTFRFEDPLDIDDANRAEGFTFLVSKEKRQGNGGSSLGYDGIDNALVIEFDTKKQTELDDPDSNHISIHVPGEGSSTLFADERDSNVNGGLWGVSDNQDVNFHDGVSHTVIISYTPENVASRSPAITVFVDDESLPRLNDVEIPALADILDTSGAAYVGFTSGTSVGDDVPRILIESWTTAIVSPGASASDLGEVQVLTAGVQEQFEVTLRDVCGRPITVGGHADLLECTLTVDRADSIGNDPDAYPLPRSCVFVDQGNGKYHVNVMIQRAGYYTMTVKLNSVTILEGEKELRVLPAAVYAPNCFAQESVLHNNLEVAMAGDSDLLDDQPHSFEVVTMDQFFNYVQSGTGEAPVVEFGDSGFTGKNEEGRVATVTAGPSYVYVAEFYATNAGEHEVRIQVGNVYIGGAPNQFAPPNFASSGETYRSPSLITINPGPAVASASSFVLASIPSALLYSAGTDLSFEIVLTDRFGNVRAPGDHSDRDLINLAIAPESPKTVNIDFDIDVTNAGTQNGENHGVEFVIRTASTQEVDNSPIGTYEITAVLTSCGSSPIVDDCAGQIDLFKLNIEPDIYDAGQSYVVTMPPYVQATIQTTIQIQGQDRFGNNQVSSGESDEFVVDVTSNNGGSVSGFVEIQPEHAGNGVHEFVINPDVVGDYNVQISLDGKGVIDNGVTYSTHVLPGPISHLESEVLGESVLSATVDDCDMGAVILSFEVILRDGKRNERTQGLVGGGTVPERLNDSSQIFLAVGAWDVTPSATEATYTVSWCTTTSGTYSLSVLATSIVENIPDEVANSPLSVEVRHGPVSAAKSTADGAVGAVQLQNATFQIRARDRFDNDVTDSGEESNFYLNFSTTQGPLQGVLYEIEHIDGNEFGVVYTVPTNDFVIDVYHTNGLVRSFPTIIPLSADFSGLEHSNARALENTWNDGQANRAPTVAGVRASFVVQDYTYTDPPRAIPFNTASDTEHCVYPFNGTSCFDGSSYSMLFRGPLQLESKLENVDDPQISYVVTDITDKEDGTYELFYTAEVAGNYRVRVTYLGLDIYYPSYTDDRDPTAVGKTDLEVTHANPHFPRFVVTQEYPSLTAGETNRVTVALFDEFGNRIQTLEDIQDVKIILKIGEDDFTDAWSPSTSYDSSGGLHMLSYTPEKAGQHNVIVTFPGFEGDQTLITNVAPDVLSAPHSAVQISENEFTAGEEVTFELLPTDKFGNALSTTSTSFGDDAWSVDVGGLEAVVTYEPRGDGGGKYVVVVQPTTSGMYQIIAKVDTVDVPDKPRFTVVPAGAYSAKFTSYPESSKAGESAAFEVQVYDRYDNLRSAGSDNTLLNVAIDGKADQCSSPTSLTADTYGFDCTSFTAGDVDVSARIADGQVTPAVTLRVIPADTWAPNCKVSSRRPSGDASEGESVSITFEAFDQYDNKQIHHSDVITLLILTQPSSCDESDDDFQYIAVELVDVVSATVEQEAENGTYKIAFQSRVAGSFAFDIIVNSNEPVREDREENTVNQLFCPFDLTIFPDILHPPSTQFSEESYETIAGVSGVFVMSWFDQYGNAVDTDPDEVQIGTDSTHFGTRNSLAGDGTIIELPISDAAGNTFAVTYSSERAGTYPLVVEVMDANSPGIADSNMSITILTAMLDPAASSHPELQGNEYWEVSTGAFDEFATTARAVAGLPGVWRVEANDAFGNAIDGSEVPFAFSSRGTWFDTHPTAETVGQTIFDVVPTFTQAFSAASAEVSMRDASYLTVWSGTYDVSVLVRVCGDEEGQQISVCNETAFEDLGLAFEVGFSVYTLIVDPATCGALNPLTPYRCENRDCVATWADCPGSTSTDDMMLGPDDCPAGTTFCAHGSYCAPGFSCPPADVCGGDFHQCQKDGSCRQSADDCPSTAVCPPSMKMCPDGHSCAFPDSYETECDVNRTQKVCDGGFFTCFDGSCAFERSDCPTPISCSGDQVLCATDQSCRASASECPSQYSCFGDTPYRCVTGECRASNDDCPDLVTCPFTWVKCPDGHCARSTSECQRYEPCGLDMVRCPDSTCRPNLLHCSTRTTCKDDEVLCSDGSCKDFLSDCGSPADCAEGYKCPDGFCASDESLCPTLSGCSLSAPVMCSSGSCAKSSADCPATVHCPPSLPHRCADGSCKALDSQCSRSHTCSPAAPFQCFDSSCRADQLACPDADLGVCKDGLRKCSDGECVTSLTLCSTPASCREDEVKCSDNTCRSRVDGCGDSNGVQCPAMQVRCNDGRSCRESHAQCPTRRQCPPENPVRCADHSCAASANACPASNLQCASDRYLICPDGTCSLRVSTTGCGSAKTCPPEFPALCFDSSCRATLADCPATRVCPNDAPYLCNDGACADNQQRCTGDGVSCPSSTPVRCPSNTCVASADECETGEAFTTCDVDNGLYLCADQSCMSTPDQCDGLERTCPESLPTVCPDGMCVDNALQCRDTETYCPSNRPFKCSSGKCCESDNEACCGDTLTTSDCPEEEVLCPDGSCAPEGECPTANGCNIGCGLLDIYNVQLQNQSAPCGVRCFSGHCVESEAQCMSLPLCPPTYPVRCFNGLCVQASAQCPPAVQGPELTDGLCSGDTPIACANGECVSSDSHCPPVYSCDTRSQERCADGTCRDFGKCPLADNFCPQQRPHLCETRTNGVSTFEGVCVLREDDCPIKDLSNMGCTAGSPLRCPGGRCVADLAECVTSSANGCPTETPYKCHNGLCVLEEEKDSACPSLSGCDPETPFRCADGACVVNGGDCSDSAECPSGTQRCADGDCKASLSDCQASNGCPIAFPHRCVNGACARSISECEPVATCDPQSWTPHLCDNQECVGHPSLCRAVTSCTLPDSEPGVFCSDQRCVATLEDCSAVESTACPAGSPVRCVTGKGNCVASQNLCETDESECNLFPFVYRCFDGFCADSRAECVNRGQQVNTSCTVCYDGSCADTFGGGECPPVPACLSTTSASSSTRPFRCDDGACETDEAACKEVDACQDREVRCADGSCRAEDECPAYIGCWGDAPYQCNDLSCAKEESECPLPGQTTTSSWLRYANCVGGTFLFNPSETTQYDICYHNGAAVASIAVSSGGLIRNTNVDSETQLLQDPDASSSDTSTWPTITISPVATSKMRDLSNFIHASRQDEFGTNIAFDGAVASAAFRCSVDDDVDVVLPITVVSQVDLDLHPNSYGCVGDDQECTLLNVEDVCLARIIETNGRPVSWGCVQSGGGGVTSVSADGRIVADAIPTSDSVVCTPEGRSYAFIVYPQARVVDDAVESNWLADNWEWLLIGIICGTACFAVCGFMLIRAVRYRTKYKKTKDEAVIMQKQFDEMQEQDDLGMGHFGQMGPGAHIQVNPLSQAAKGGEDEEILAEKLAMKEEIRRSREDALRARQEIEMMDSSFKPTGFVTDMGGQQLGRRNDI